MAAQPLVMYDQYPSLNATEELDFRNEKKKILKARTTSDHIYTYTCSCPYNCCKKQEQDLSNQSKKYACSCQDYAIEIPDADPTPRKLSPQTRHLLYNSKRFNGQIK